MSKTLYFYDLETTGLSSSESRIMQFAGQRTSLDMKLIGEPQNILIKLAPDILPDPRAIMVTGITPQQTITDGVTEAEFLKIFHKEIVERDTIFVGYNSVRFDDEFIRYLHYRNFYDAYEWQWRDGRGKWDLLDVVRMTRALRPDGIKWPIVDSKPSNRLEELTKANGISHTGAHDALADVIALIDLAKLINESQPKLFSYLLNIMTSKKNIESLINNDIPFVYTSGKFDSEYEKTTVVSKLVSHPKRQAVLVFDLRYNIDNYVNLSVEELVKAWRPEDRDQPRLPIKDILFNRCPAIAPLSVLDEDSEKRIGLNKNQIETNYKKLEKVKINFSKKLLEALVILDATQEAKYSNSNKLVDAQLYDGFFGDGDKRKMEKVRNTNPSDLVENSSTFSDKRLNKLLPLYKARNYPKLLTSEEIAVWDKYRTEQLLGGNEFSKMKIYFDQLVELGKSPDTNKDKSFLIDELKLYGESIIPTTEY